MELQPMETLLFPLTRSKYIGFIYETTDNGLTWNETMITDVNRIIGDNANSLKCAIDSSGINGDIVVFAGQYDGNLGR